MLKWALIQVYQKGKDIIIHIVIANNVEAGIFIKPKSSRDLKLKSAKDWSIMA